MYSKMKLPKDVSAKISDIYYFGGAENRGIVRLKGKYVFKFNEEKESDFYGITDLINMIRKDVIEK